MVKLAYDPKMKSPKGPCVIVIHANWCGFCKTLIPKFENEIVTSQDFSKELEGLLTLGSIEETDYNNHPEKNIFGNIDGYPIVRYIHFSQDGKPMRSFDLPPTTPRDPEDIIAWINDAVKNDVVKNHKKHRKSKKQHRGGKKKKCRTMRKKYKYDKYGKKK
jgi:thiol-disulfide isomerase/thioredoxin